MVKHGLCPIVAVVTGATTLTQRAFVCVVLAMTGSAIVFDIMESIAFMACAASDRGVQAGKWKSRQIVIESYRLAPAGLLVAGFTFLPELLSVRIIYCVTLSAGCRHFLHR